MKSATGRAATPRAQTIPAPVSSREPCAEFFRQPFPVGVYPPAGKELPLKWDPPSSRYESALNESAKMKYALRHGKRRVSVRE
jgi:hypothetical protein